MASASRSAPFVPGWSFWLAVALCAVLATGRSMAGWHDLAALRLPDTDDLMRLVQIRDWIGGQAFSDLTQYRLGPEGGTPMHWSRLGDIGPAAIILLAEPLVGMRNAELVALILWPSLLLLAFVLIAGEVAARLSGPAVRPVAIVLAALAWPAAGLFVPGRIDHHGLQLVLLFGALLAMTLPATIRTGAAAGIAIAASLTVGMEAAAPIAILCAHAVLRWVWVGDAERTRLGGLALGLGGGLALSAVLAPANWSYPACDAFTRQSSGAAFSAVVALGALALLPATVSRSLRIGAAGLAGTAVIAAVAWIAPTCLSDPYAMIDPVVRAGWLSQVDEARGLTQLSASELIAHAGLPFIAALAALAGAARRRDPEWMLTTALVVGSLLLAFHQARAVHIAAALAPVVLAPCVAHLRAHRPGVAPLAWLVSIGISYPLAALLLPQPVPASARCDFDAAVAQLRELRAGTVLAPIDLGPRLLVETGHRAMAAPYHRNQAGIAAWIAMEQHPRTGMPEGVDYLIACDTDRGTVMLRST